jgi:hypothetical protein
MQSTFLYIDPGAGSMLIQLLIGVFVAISIFFRRIRTFIFHLFKRKDKSSAIEDEN